MDEYVADYTYQQGISCISENGSWCCRIDDDRVGVVTYEKVAVWNVRTLSAVGQVDYSAKSSITALSAPVSAAGEVSFIIGHENGMVVHLDEQGESLSGYRETTKKIIGVVTNRDIAVSFTTHSFTVYDLHTETVILTVPLTLVVSNVSICDGVLVVGSDKGVVHQYLIANLVRGNPESDTTALSAQPVVLSLADQGEIWVVQLESATRLSDRRRVELKHRIAAAATDRGLVFTRDTKNKYRLWRISEAGLAEDYSFKQSRPVASVCLAGASPVLAFADNGLGVYRGAEDASFADAGRDNLIGLAECGGVVLGITPTEGRVFGRVVSKEELAAKNVSLALFEEDSAKMTCLIAQSGNFYLGKDNGTISVRSPLGEEIQLLTLSASPITSVSRLPSGMMAVATDNRVILCTGHERDEIIYDDEVLCTKLSPDGTLILASLADNTVKVHKIDGEHLLTLFGHSVPVVAIELCLEQAVVVTLGGDKLVKVWGLRHGECRKTLNPGDPTGILLHDNLLLVSTAYGLIYYLKETLTKVKRVEYPAGKKRGTAGAGRLVVSGYHLLTIRERSVALFQEGEFGTSPEEQARLEEDSRELAEIAQEKKIFKLSVIEQLEEAIDNNQPNEVCRAIEQLPRADLHTAIEMMNTQTRDQFGAILQQLLSGDYHPLFMSWALTYLIKTGYANEAVQASREAVRQKLRQYSRETRANSTAIQWIATAEPPLQPH